MTALLRQNWRALAPPSPAAESVFDDLCRRYAEPSRFYHTRVHIENLLVVTHTLRARVPSADWPAVQFAVWFHDAVYDTRTGDNEEKSARLAVGALAKLNVAETTIEKTARLILATKTHEIEKDDLAGAVLLDADLAILGAGENEYDAYAQAVRREWAWVAEPEWRAGRSRVLENFLARETIYRTDKMQRKCEAAARRNLMREAARLTGRQPDVLQ